MKIAPLGICLSGQLAAIFHLPLHAQVLMSSATESELIHATRPPPEVVKLILHGETQDNLLFNECLRSSREHGMSANRFFSSRRIDLNGDELPDYFVRPALQPYCSAFYGAHLFRYWLVVGVRKNAKTDYQIVFAYGGDEVRVLRHRSNGYRDLELFGHTAEWEARSTWHYDGKRYVSTACSIRNIDPENKAKISCETAE
ncbi:hypothetical protein ACFFKC_11220 [Pseudoduganella danionis]|uniref:Uncharacterized protein n=1 Tax=Pseudoduganella danionis TaxID=1890295 RepID=A0ABW9SJS6_9BURK|nr:hypothetical protein [Pseudoduganella danionis]MTW32411.1 hypothetical protein [Pseudoduganella danionis]